jgi:hypothetical protein
MIHNPALLPKVRSDRIMRAARGQPCSLRLASFVPGRRCTGEDTTVACHMPVDGKAMGSKVSDLSVAFGCFTCHQIIDGVDQEAAKYLRQHYPAAFMERLLKGMAETQARLVMDGIITILDAEIIG